MTGESIVMLKRDAKDCSQFVYDSDRSQLMWTRMKLTQKRLREITAVYRCGENLRRERALFIGYF